MVLPGGREENFAEEGRWSRAAKQGRVQILVREREVGEKGRWK